MSLASPVYIDVDEGRKEVAINTISFVCAHTLLHSSKQVFLIFVKIGNCRLQTKAWSKVTALCQVQSG